MADIDWSKGSLSGPDGKPVDTTDWSSGVLTEPPKPAGAIRKIADLGLSVGKGVIAVPEAAVGLANLVTGGHAGKLAESAGVRFKDAKDVLSGWQSDDFKGKQQQFQQADGIIEKTGVALSNPSLIANTVAESLPLMGAGGVGARALLGVAPKIGAATAGAIGEGIAGAGSSGEQYRQESADGLLTGKQAALAGASGAATAAFGAAGGKLAQKLGIGDIDTMIAGGTRQVAAGAAPKGAIRRMAEGALSEGVLEELPQSLSEQGFQNVALDRPVTQGMEDAGVMGVLTGGVMGAGAGAISRQAQPAPNQAPTDQAPAVPPAIEPSSLQSAPASQSALPGQTQQVSSSSTGSLPQNTLSNQSPNQSLDQAGFPLGSPGTKEAESLAAREAEVQQIVAASGGNPGALAKVAIASIQSGASGEIQLQQANEADQAAYEQATAEQAKQAAEQDTANQSLTKIAEKQAYAAMSEEDKRAILFSNKTVADGGKQYVGTQDGDILNGMGKPYPNRLAAARRANMEGKDWTIAPVFDGFVARRKDANEQPNGVQSNDSASTGYGRPDATASVGLESATGNGVAADTGGQPSPVLGESDQLPAGAVAGAVKRLQQDASNATLGNVSNQDRSAIVSEMDANIVTAIALGIPEESVFAAINGEGSAQKNLSALVAQNTSPDKSRTNLGEKLEATNVQDPTPVQPEAGNGTAVQEGAKAPEVVASAGEGAPAVDAKSANLARIQAANRPQPTTLGAQTNAVAGPGFGVSDVVPKQPQVQAEQGQVATGDVANQPWSMTKDTFDSWPRAMQWGFARQQGIKAETRNRDADQEKNANILATTPGSSNGGTKAPDAFFADIRNLHKEIVEKALAEGRPVPTDVLADYPDLQNANANKVGRKDSAQLAQPESVVSKPVTQPAQPVTQPDQQSGARVQFFQPPTEKHKKGILYTGEIVTRGGKQVVTLDKDSPSFAAGVREVAYRENGGWEPAQPVTGEGAGASQPTQVAAAPAATKDKTKALDRIAKGMAYFGNAIKAAEFIRKNGLKETHKAVKTSATRWDIVAKDSQPKESTNGTQAPETVQATQEGQKAPAASTKPVTERQARIESTLSSGGKVVGGTLRTSNGMNLMTLTEAELAVIHDTKKDTSEAISARADAVYGNKPVTPQLPPAAPVSTSPAVQDFIDGKRDDVPTIAEVSDETKARNLLMELQAKQDANGMVGDDRLETQINQVKREIKAMAGADKPAEPAKAPEAPKPDALSEKEKAAKAKMFNALGKLAALASKNTRMNWTPEEEQQLLPIVIELFDGAMELGSVTFQKAVRYVREFIASNLDQETADAIPFETLQGAYIHTARKFKDQGATPGKEVMSFDSLAELENSDDKADTSIKDAQNEPTTGNHPDSSGAGVQDEQPGKLQPDAGSVRRGNAKSNTGNASRGTDKNAPPDYVPAAGGLTREGSWYETAKRNIDLIELAIKIDSENRPATSDEQSKLSKYVGFGASAIRNELFPVPPGYAKAQEPNRLIWPQYVRNDRFKPLAERIEALPREWQQSILQSSQYAHYTSEGIIRSVWGALERMGFKGGQVFEPGMGIGSFAMLMPDAIRAESRYTGVEFDAPTALIAKLLSPQQNMLHGDFIKGRYPKNFFDVNVGNPPFSQTKIFGDPEYAKKGFMLHDFFFAKGIDLVRPGGIQVFVTSKGTMDKQTDKARKYLSERADLLGAIRLPSTAFEDNAGTSVVTDVIFLRKRLPGVAPAGEAWENTATVETKDGPVVVNEYFAKHPEMVLGQQRISGNVDDQGRRINSNGMGGEKYTVVSYDSTPAELEAKFAKAIEKLPEGAYSEKQGKTEKAKDARVDFDPSVKREGVVYLAKDGTLMRVAEGVGVPLENTTKLNDKDQAWFKSYVGLRDLVQEARFAQLNEKAWEAALAKLNKAYDKFVKEHGHILDYRVMTRKSTDEEGNVVETESRIPKNRRLLREDYDQALVTSLETITEDGSIVKSPFLKGRTIGKPVSREVKSIGDALAVSLDETGHFDLADVGKRLKLDEEATIEALGNQIFQTPDGDWQLTDEYLSGDVVAKLEEAEAAARINPDLKRNVEALKEAQPEKLGPAQISAKLGASWIPESHVNAFAQEISAGQVTFDARTETWQVDGGNKQTGRMAGAEYGTARRSPSELLEAILNSRSIKITQTVDKKTVPDQEATTAANEMAKKIKDKFKGWVWTDTDRATELVESYNKNFNNIAPRKFDGSHLTLPGVSLRYKLHPHQLRAIWRMIQTGNTYLAHAVGAGKTIEMIAGGMEQKRLGLIKKPIYVVPNHMLEQFSNEFMELYPLANIMVADDENFSPERRKAFIASATLNSPDAIVITHDAFQRIGVKEESVAPIRDEILADLEIELSETAKGNDTRVRRGQLEQQIEAVKQRFDRIVGAGAKDSTIKFEDMGVDFVFADEAHVFRKLDFHTAQQIKGIDPNGSKRALDMYVKTRILEKKKPGRSMVFASGTPVTNTMGELYTIMRFFAGAELDKSGISTFDAWARQFGEVAPALEPNAAGKYELIERFAKFDNVPELMSRVRQFMDVLTSDNLGALVKRPDIKGGKPNLNIIPTNSDLTDYMKGELARRIDISRAWKPSKDEPHNPDPIVAIITDGRFAAIDPRFFGGKLAEGDKSIITEMGDKVAASYHATKNDVYLDKDGKEEKIKGSTQIVFYNLGFGEQSQRSRGFNSRAAFTKRLTDGGIPRAEIAWFDDANSDAKKEAVFKAMRNGSIKVLIGSAKKMGTGVNVQKRLAVLHYQDPPWFPADVEQPHGRILRQGNQNEEIAIEWYTTKGTYQSTMWQMVGRKQRFIDQAFTGDKTLRSMDDLGEASLFEQAAAVASGDPRAIQLAGLKQDVERFTRLQAAHANEQMNVRSALNSAAWQIESGQKSIKTLEKAFKAIGEKYFAFTAGRVNGRDYTKPGEFGQAIKDEFNRLAADSVMGELVKDKQIASLGAAIKVTMDAYIGKGNKPDGTFDFYVEFGGSAYQLGNTAAMGADVDAVGLARRIFNKINEVDSELQRKRRELAANEVDAIKLRKKMGAPFEYQQEMAEKYGELKRLEAELEAEGKATPAAKASLVIKADGTANGEAPEVSTNLKQTGAPEGNTSDVVFSTRTSAPEKQLPLQQIERLVQSALRGVKNAPTVRVVASPEAIGLRSPVDTVPSGVTLANGDIYVFQSGVGSALDVDMVVFHELFHKGLQNVMPRSDYVAAMQDIAKIDAKVRQYASEWSDSNAGKDQLKELAKKYSGKELADQYEALATEEGLARIAEDLKAKREMGTKDMRVRRLVSWLAKMADKIGMTRLAESLRAMSYSEAEKFVIATIGRAGGRKLSSDGGAKFSSRDIKDAVTNKDVVGNQGGRSADDTTPGADKYQMAGSVVDGREVRDDVPNMSSIAASLDDYTVLKGVREVPMSDFTFTGKSYSVSETKRIENLAERIKESGEINPLIVVVDKEGSYVLEGGHRGEALFRLGAKSFPAVVVLDNESLNESTAPDSGGAQTDTSAFKAWFGGSRVVDADGKPLVVYHGTKGDFDAFDASKQDPRDAGFWFGSKGASGSYAASSRPSGENVMPVYLSIKNPKVYYNRDVKITPTLIEQLTHEGYDGVLRDFAAGPDAWRYGADAAPEWATFNPTQIKSAIGNNGNFDASNPDIRFRAADTLSSAANNVRNVKLPAGYLVGDLINGAPGKLNWWHRSVGTMYNLAQRSAPFKRVFDSVQTFINDVSYYATEAADLAPKILPKLETWKDIAKSPLSAADTKAISAPIFEGTLTWARDESGKPVKVATLEAAAAQLTPEQKAQRLLRGDHISANLLKMWQGLPIDQYESLIEGKYESDMLKAGIVFTPAELKALFGLTGEKQTDGTWSGQIGLYQEFRKATDKSLTNLAIADMLRFGGEDVMPIREQVLASKDVSEAAETLRDYLLSLTDIDPDRSDVLTDTADKMIEKGDRAKDLIDRGYAPLSRFGQYTLDVVHDGERVYFSMFESKWEAARMNRQMQTEYPGAKITQGTVSEQSYKMFAGVSPETLELFGDMLGLEAQGDDASAKAFQEYLKLAKSSRSAMKRLIHRKGIAGFNEDAGRVLAGFVYSNARQTASSLHMGEMTNAANDISQTQGEMKDAAVKLVDYIKNPQEEAQKLRGLLFAQYIGGSVASAMVNMTQPLTMTFPWLSQYGGVASAAKQMTAAMKDSSKKLTGDAKLDAALHRAEEDGTVSPQEVHQLLQQSMGKGALQSGDGTTAGNAMATANNTLSRFSLGWGKLFSVAEQFNRRVTFIAAYRTAVTQGMADPDAFARKAVAETQGVYNKGNKPAWARGALGSTLFTFKQYSIAYVEMISRMAKAGKPGSKERAQGQKAALLALGVLFLMSGAGGMPGADDLDDIISGALQALGYNFDSKARRKEFFVSLFGEGGAQFVERGVSGLPGVPIDVSGRMGLGNLIPGTGLFTKKTDHTRDVAELAGPAGDLAKRTFEAAGKLIKGDVAGSAVSVSPKAFQNLHQAYDMANMGMYRDASGKKVVDTDGYDAIAKAIGFQPTDVKRIQDASIEVQRMIGLNKMRESEIADKWALGMFEKNPAKVEDARNDLKTWNADNPSSPIRINFGQIIKRVQKMNETKTQRIAKTAPREIRETVRKELATQ